MVYGSIWCFWSGILCFGLGCVFRLLEPCDGLLFISGKYAVNVLAWCRGDVPSFMSNEELVKFGMNIDPSYTSKVLMKDLKPNETHLEFYKRSFNITRLLMKSVGQNTGNVMIIGHAASLEACTRQLVGGQPRTTQELTKLVQKIPYCGVCVCQESESGKNSTWDFIDPPVPPLTHAPNIRFDWRCLQ